MTDDAPASAPSAHVDQVARDKAAEAMSEIRAHQRECVIHYAENQKTLDRIEQSGHARSTRIAEVAAKVDSLASNQNRRQGRETVIAAVIMLIAGIATGVAINLFSGL